MGPIAVIEATKAEYGHEHYGDIVDRELLT
jgi:hypothetical protein